MSSRKTETRPKSILLITSQGSDVTESPIPPPCKHNAEYYFLFLTAELVAVSCPQCQQIKLLKLKTKEFTDAFKAEWVWRMCHGGENRIFVQGKKNEVLELILNESSLTFTKTNTIHSGIQSRYSGLCYVPSPPGLHRGNTIHSGIQSRYSGPCYVPSPPGFVVVADNSDKPKVRAVDCSLADKGVPFIVWTFSEEVDGKKISPKSVVYSPTKDVIIVGDGVNSRLLVLDRKEGTHAQTIGLPDVNVVDMHLRGDELVLLHSSGDEYNISYFSLK